MQHLARTLLPDLARLVIVSFLALSLAVLSGCGEASPEPDATSIIPTATVPPPTATTPAPTAIPPTATVPPPTATISLPTSTTAPPTATALPPTVTPAPPTPTALAETADTGDWELLTSSDAMTDRQRIVVALRSTAYAPARGDDQALLFIRCSYGGSSPHRWEAFINWDTYLASEGPVSAIQRFGEGAPVAVRWQLGTGKQATFIPTNGRGLADFVFVALLQQHDRFAARVERYNDSAVTAVWDVSGLTAALQPLTEKCPA